MQHQVFTTAADYNYPVRTWVSFAKSFRRYIIIYSCDIRTSEEDDTVTCADDTVMMIG